VYVKCPQCGKNPLVYDPERGEIVCPHCGLVIDDRPLVHVANESREQRREKAVLIAVIRDTWLRASLEVLRKLYKHVFFDQCTLKTAEKILAEIYNNTRKRPDYEHAAKFAVLVASRKCGEYVKLKKLFNSISEIYELLTKHEYLHKLYTPPDKTTQTRQLALKIAECLEEKGVTILEDVAEKTKNLKLDTASGKPLNIAIAIVHNVLRGKTSVDVDKIAECSDTTINIVKNAIRSYARHI
jgi:transcription initiation factor TFIIIB Brf1 subunit/transcription initiation factor TFIIB